MLFHFTPVSQCLLILITSNCLSTCSQRACINMNETYVFFSFLKFIYMVEMIANRRTVRQSLSYRAHPWTMFSVHWMDEEVGTPLEDMLSESSAVSNAWKRPAVTASPVYMWVKMLQVADCSCCMATAFFCCSGNKALISVQ